MIGKVKSPWTGGGGWKPWNEFPRDCRFDARYASIRVRYVPPDRFLLIFFPFGGFLGGLESWIIRYGGGGGCGRVDGLGGGGLGRFGTGIPAPLLGRGLLIVYFLYEDGLPPKYLPFFSLNSAYVQPYYSHRQSLLPLVYLSRPVSTNSKEFCSFKQVLLGHC